ncbi:MAG: bifunctional oligoribonuclease/PAP phosphatase NrnA [Desulfobacterales bacterium]|nr:bifunctional oligoribonuclease/PAP phosphatase NrnA [Desulfobacterales bacterium]
MTIQPNETVGRIADELRDKRNILLATHIFPDGDALGSQLALGAILESLGKKPYYYSEERVSHIYDFMPGCEQLDNRLPDPARFDAAVVLDCGDRFRLGRRMDELLTIHPFIVIDHHAGHKEFGDLRWVDPARSSTGEMVYELATTLSGSISPQAAFCLLTAIVSDTGSFKYESTTANTFRVAGALVDKGGRPSEVAGKLFNNFTPGRLRLLEKVLKTLELHDNDRIALITVTSEMLAATGTTRDDTEDFINYPRSLNTVKAAAFFKEAGDGWVGVSLRAKGECDVARIAGIFGGGGHRNAAGFRLQGTTLAAVRADLLRELQAALASS